MKKLLIRSNCPKAIKSKDFIVSESGGPYALRKFGGWTVVGAHQCPDDFSNVSCHRVYVEELASGKAFQHHFVIDNKVKEIICSQEYGQSL